MQRYVIIAWNARIPLASLQAQELRERILALKGCWKISYESDGISILTEFFDSRAWSVVTHTRMEGALIGTVFDRKTSASKPLTAIADDEAAEISASKGEVLISSYWGRYVAILKDGDSGLAVLRDPSGALPCYYTRSDQLFVAFSSGLDILRCVRPAAAFDLHNIAKRIRLPTYQGGDTAFDGLRMLQPGQRLTLNGKTQSCATLWDPRIFATAPHNHTAARAAEALEKVVTDSVQSWGSAYEAIAVQTSGGLDSSIVLDCLARGDGGPALFPTHFYSPNTDSDERSFAQLIAQHYGMVLTEHELDASTFDLSKPSLRPTIDPIVNRSEKISGEELRHVSKHGLQAIFGGRGGDNVFLTTRTSDAAIDYLSDHGLGKGFFSALIDSAILSSSSIWHVLADVVRARFSEPTQVMEKVMSLPTFLSEDFQKLTTLEHLTHDWVKNLRSVPRGKIPHLRGILATHIYPTSNDYFDFVYPLVSQPVVEYCLRTPTYLLAHQGVSRHLARQAFAERLPPEIAFRLSKASGNRFYATALQSALPKLRELLLDGLLCEMRVLDRMLIEENCKDDVLLKQPYMTQAIYNGVLIENWIRAVMEDASLSSAVYRAA